MINFDEAKREFDRSMSNIIITYRFFSRALPPEAIFKEGRPITLNGTEFERYEQALAMLVELGWALFCRMDASVEALIQRIAVQPKSILATLESCPEITPEDIQTYRTARELRNIIHHGDGDAGLLNRPATLVRVAQDKQPHLYPEHVERFHRVFSKAGDCLARPRLCVV